ncbi:YhgE/Pip domain-containing protein [Polycladomyces subterraneus]|uniref:YhgE/Pip domain-containing protein n=1 Tax=Polycladomyces subterraneus TaxID=1016997 RepID=A0ABT8IKA7_9BACL|nr:YhgE/Pip domain-containing protein [Polycladomyces subterraneus]MDN4593173.1 YhgE/Pip domain-containing protein [Polycladomyces subterraneus]
MNTWKLLSKEFTTIVHNKKLLIALILVLFIPLLYGGSFIGAFQDPYGRLDQLPVAVVNLDKGATVHGKKLHLGKDLVDKLRDKRTFDWKFVSDKVAQEGLKDWKYYMIIRIPQDFSKNAGTLMDEHPQHLKLEYIVNDSHNFIAKQIGQTATEKIKQEVSTALIETYAESMFDVLKELSNGYAKASDGASKLRNGSWKAEAGAAKLHEGLKKAAANSILFEQGLSSALSGSNQLQQGAEQLSTGLGQLKNGGDRLSNAALQLQNGTSQLSDGLNRSLAGMDEISNNIGKLTSGSVQVQNGSQQLANGSEQLRAGLGQLSERADVAVSQAQTETQDIASLRQQVQEIENDPNVSDSQKARLNQLFNQLESHHAQAEQSVKTVAGTASVLSDKSGELSQGATQLAAGAEKVATGQAKLASGFEQLRQAQSQLAAGANQLLAGEQQFAQGFFTFNSKLGEAQSGASKIAYGSGSLSTGIGKLADGSGKMTDGLGKLAGGSGGIEQGLDKMGKATGELASKLRNAAKESGEVNGNQSKYDMFAEPVHLSSKEQAPVPNYGTAMTPYFLSLALFVGGLMLSAIYPFPTPFGQPRNGLTWFISKYIPIVLVVIIQSLVVDAIILWGLDIHVKNVPYFLLFTILTSITFMSLVFCIVSLVGPLGKFIAIATMVLQLTSSAGTFPAELLPDFFRTAHDYLPMTYAVSGFKAVISSGDYSFMWEDGKILLSYFTVFVVVTMVKFVILYRKQFKAVRAGQRMTSAQPA